MHEIVLTEHDAGQRLDRYLRKLLAAVPLGAIFRHLRGGAIRVDGKKAEGSLRLVAGMCVSLRLPAADLPTVDASARPVASAASNSSTRDMRRTPHTPRIVHRDDDVMVVVKPAGMASQPGTGQDHDLTRWVLSRPYGVRSATFKPAPVHRLDRGTSGLVAIGLSPLGLRGLAAAFREDHAMKVYIAIVHGVPVPARGSIDAPLLQYDDAPTRSPKVVVDPAGKPARTDYEVVTSGRSRSQLRLTLHTGRLHQIRAHLAHLGHPIVGDRRYGSPADVGRDVFLLHATELAFPHPRTGEMLVCKAPPPSIFAPQLAGD